MTSDSGDKEAFILSNLAILTVNDKQTTTPSSVFNLFIVLFCMLTYIALTQVFKRLTYNI